MLAFSLLAFAVPLFAAQTESEALKDLERITELAVRESAVKSGDYPRNAALLNKYAASLPDWCGGGSGGSGGLKNFLLEDSWDEYKPRKQSAARCREAAAFHDFYPSSSLALAFGLLKLSPHGRRIAQFIEKKDLLFAYNNRSGENALARYLSGNVPELDLGGMVRRQGLVVLSPGTMWDDPLEKALLVAHEGWHAIQDIEWGMANCREKEQEAAFLENVVYVELLKAGVPRLPRESSWEREFRRFENDFQENKSRKQWEESLDKYFTKEREALLDHWARPAHPIWRIFYRRYLEATKGMELSSVEPLDVQRRRISNVWRRAELDSAERIHRMQLDWQRRWAQNNSDFIANDRLATVSDEVLRLDPNNVEELMESSFAQYHAGHFQRAFADAAKVISVEPGKALAYYYRAQAAAKLGRSRQADEDYRKALRLDPALNRVQ